MRVKLSTGRAGRGFTQRPGDEIEVSQAEGEALIRSGSAEPCRDRPPVETAVRQATVKRKHA